MDINEWLHAGQEAIVTVCESGVFMLQVIVALAIYDFFAKKRA